MSSFLPLPARRLLLGLIVLAGLGLRLWGLAWGLDGQAGLTSQEWLVRIIALLGLEHPVSGHLWPQAFLSLAALFKSLVSSLAGWTELWLGAVRSLAEVNLSALMAGRLMVAVLGAGQAGLAYWLARRVFDSPASGLLAAAAVAAAPLLSGQSHLLSLGVPLGFMVLASLSTSWTLLEFPSPWRIFSSGLVLGLTVTTAPTGFLMLPVVLIAYWIGQKDRRKTAWQGRFWWPACLLGGLLAGFTLGCPLVLVDPSLPFQLMAQAWPRGAALGALGSHLAAQAAGTFRLGLQVGGLELLVLWLAAVAILIFRRRWRRLLPALPAVLYMAVGLWLPAGDLGDTVAVWLPLLAVLAVWPLVLVCRRLPSYPWQVAAACLAGILLVGLPLWRALGLGYLFWQEDTLTAARRWLTENLPAGVQVVTGPDSPAHLSPATHPFQKGLTPEDFYREGRYLVLSHPQGGPLPPAKAALAAGLQRVARFDLSSGWGLGGAVPGQRFPAWLSPPVEIYAPEPPSSIREPLAVTRPPAGFAEPYAVVYADSAVYGRNQTIMLVPLRGRSHRVLRRSSRLNQVAVELRNLGEDYAEVAISQWPWPDAKLHLYPGQRERVLLSPSGWPPMTDGIYSFKLDLTQGRDLWASLSGDPLIMGRWALESGDYAEAVSYLLAARQSGPPSFEAAAMLAGALALNGQLDEADRVLHEPGLATLVAAGYRRLIKEPPGPDWDRRFQALTGYHPALLRHALSLGYQVNGPACVSRGTAIPLKGPGFYGALLRHPGGVAGNLTLRLEAPFPAGPLAAVLDLSTGEKLSAGHKLARAEVWGRGPEGERLYTSRVITARDLPQGHGVVALPFRNSHQGTRFTLKLEFLSQGEVLLNHLDLQVDLAGHMRRILRWQLDAWGRVYLHQGRFRQAVDAFEELLTLDPAARQIYLPLARALIDLGRLERALELARQAEKTFSDFPDELTKVKDLYQALQRPEDAQRVESRLSHLRPSLFHESRFAEGLTLLGYDLDATQVAPGGHLDVSYYWKAYDQVPMNYYVFVHLGGPDKTLIFDHLLDHGRVNMTELEPGQVVREDYRIEVPKDTPPGAYTLIVGLWDARFTKQGLPILAGEDQGQPEAHLATVLVK
ncbi:MAG: tetratricopeptide repeat protein [Deltaproteobacteria bacterium]|nr:tetratricopeptide repeat protein [Deltaproteobacteria bacterium]